LGNSCGARWPQRTVLASPDVFATRRGVAEGDWDSALLALDGHFLQSTPWQRVQSALGYEVLTARDAGWMWAAAVRGGAFPRYMYVPYGPTAGTDAVAAIGSTVSAARGASLDFVRAEPVGKDIPAALMQAGAVHTRAIQPRWTWVLDIDASEDDLRRGLSAGHRGSINAAPRRGLRFRSTRDPAEMSQFVELQRRAAARAGFSGRSERYHRTVASVLMPLGAAVLYIAEAEARAVAAALAFDFGSARYYAHAVSDPDVGRHLSAAAPLVWQMILDARAQGTQHFDFWGVVPDAPPDHAWAGFTRFKQAFGGRLVERPGTWDLPVRSTRYRAYALMRRLRA
jgi:FemAB family